MKMGYISCTLSFLNMTDDRFVQSYKSFAFHPKIRIVELQNLLENPKNMCSSVCKSQNVCPVCKKKCVFHIFRYTLSPVVRPFFFNKQCLFIFKNVFVCIAFTPFSANKFDVNCYSYGKQII